ncbi:hypothetical protein BDR22DRAFT_147430 [Usnea florida]
MPHKRDKLKNDASFYDLPPNIIADNVAVKKNLTITTTTANRKTKPAKRKYAQTQDDTPREFTRLLGNYRPPRSGLDDGIRPAKKARRSLKVEPANLALASVAVPTIEPREPLSSFAARVDAALPFSSLSRKASATKQGGRERQTKTERKMQKMQEEWRKEDRRSKEKMEEERDQDVDEVWDEVVKVASKGKSKGSKKRRKGGDHAGVTDDDEDPWGCIAVKRREENEAKTAAGPGAGLVGLHDVVSAPPRFSRVPKARADSCIKNGIGGLKRQHELSEARTSVVEGYRRMMREMREKGG